MRKSIVDSIQNTVADLNKSGIVDDITMKNIETLCLPEVHDYSPESIVSLRRQNHLSQAALAAVLNISPSTVRKWEQGTKKPAGASKKLLDLVERKGIEVLV
ncbi:MAG: helix-turn-helix domain-containing protein [Verrucomicrobia bacterium]|nr:helix-turn-helix domain-containing protein [Verrucomicrobiota bacterium]MCH8528064.1 helix-turn-helix domain-containing protein [Kiritimatiellia bacterium]